MDDRKEFLIKVYEQMFNDIDRHYKFIWQIVGLLIGSFTFIALSEKGIVTIDLTVSVIIILSLWVIANVYDSNYWYNRNLAIISNIERQFLLTDDQRNIHYYFGKHRSENAIQTSLKIQMYLVYGIVFIFLAYHFIIRIIPGFKIPISDANFDWIRILPYLVTVIFYLLVSWIKCKRKKDYSSFLKNSPGISIDNTGIEYGDGYPVNNK